MNAIRAARADDFEAVCRILADNALIYEDLTPASLETFVVVPSQESQAVLVAVAGLQTFPGSREGLLRSVAVSAALRGRGAGGNLVDAIEAQARTLGVRRLWLLTTTAPDFFGRLGYVNTARGDASEAVQHSGEFTSLCPASAVCLSKLLRP